MDLYKVITGVFIAGYAIHALVIGEFAVGLRATIHQSVDPGFFWGAVIVVGGLGVAELLEGIAGEDDD